MAGALWPSTTTPSPTDAAATTHQYQAGTIAASITWPSRRPISSNALPASPGSIAFDMRPHHLRVRPWHVLSLLSSTFRLETQEDLVVEQAVRREERPGVD